MKTAKAALVSKKCRTGEILDEVPLGTIYTVYPDSISEFEWEDPDSGEKGTFKMIFVANSNGVGGGLMDLSLLKLESDEPAN